MDDIKPYMSYRVEVQAKTGYIVYGPAIKKTIITLPAGEHRVILIYSFYDSMHGLHFIAEALHNQVSFDLNLNHVSVFRLFPHHLFLRQFIWWCGGAKYQIRSIPYKTGDLFAYTCILLPIHEYIIYWFVICYLAPEGPPLRFRTEEVTANSITVAWADINSDVVNGMIE